MALGALLERAKNFIKKPKTDREILAVSQPILFKTRASVEEVLKTPEDLQKTNLLNDLYDPRIPKEQKIGVKILNQRTRKERIVSGVTQTGNLILDHYHPESGEKIREAFPRHVLESNQYRIKHAGGLVIKPPSPKTPSPRVNEVVTFQKNGRERQGKVVETDKGTLVILPSGKRRATIVKKENVQSFTGTPVEKNKAASFPLEDIATGHVKRFPKKRKINSTK